PDSPTLSLHDALPISAYTREISWPVQSLIATGRLAGENFSPNCGENGSNSEVKSSVMMPVKCAATCAEVNTQNFASAEVWSPRVDRKSTRLNSSHVKI